MEKPKTPPSTLKITLCVLGALLGIFIIFVAYELFMYANPFARINFATFVPANKTLEHQELAISTYFWRIGQKNIDTLVKPKVLISYDIKNTGVSVVLQKNDNFKYDDCSYDPTAFSQVCQNRRTSKGQSYLYWRSAMDGSAKEWVGFVKNGTAIAMDVTAPTEDKLPKVDWNTLIDSLQPIKFTPQTLPVHRYNTQPL